MRCLYIDIVNNYAEFVDTFNDLQVFYNMLNCRCVEIHTIKIGDKCFTVICDEEALLKDNPMPSAFDSEIKPFLFGNLLIVNEKDGNLTGLSVDDCIYLAKYVIPVVVQNKHSASTSAYTVLVGCSWY